MSEIVIEVRIKVPDGANVTVSEARVPSPRPPTTLPLADAAPGGFVLGWDESGVPWPVETIEPLPLHGAATPPPRNDTPRCGIHHVDMTLRPAGVSKRTGREYRAFWGCTERDCKQTVNAA